MSEFSDDIPIEKMRAKESIKERHLKMPYLDLYLRLPLIEARTDLMHEAIERCAYEYIGLYLKVWKWSFKLRLYEPGEKRNQR